MRTQKNKNQAYVIVCGNEKGGSGKTTTAMHLAVALTNAGYKVATIDLDSRQQSLTRYMDNRISWARRRDLSLILPDHYLISPDGSNLVSERNTIELDKFSDIVAEVEQTHDFVVVDTPGYDGYLMRLSHSMADTLVTPMNDSFLDFDVLGNVDPESGIIIRLSHYAQTVREARRQRHRADNGLLDWVVVRNRLTQLNSKNKERMLVSLKELSMKLGCRLAEGISERVVFRELFPMGLTAFDDVNKETHGIETNASYLKARQEVRSLITSLRLPIDEVGRKRAKARKVWLESSSRPLDTAGILAE